MTASDLSNAKPGDACIVRGVIQQPKVGAGLWVQFREADPFVMRNVYLPPEAILSITPAGDHPETGAASFSDVPVSDKPTYDTLVSWLEELREFMAGRFPDETENECDFVQSQRFCRDCESAGCIKWKFDQVSELLRKARGE